MKSARKACAGYHARYPRVGLEGHPPRRLPRALFGSDTHRVGVPTSVKSVHLKFYFCVVPVGSSIEI